MLGSSTPIGEVFREWLEELEWRIARPVGWNGCWFIDPRRSRVGRDPTDQPTEFKANPVIKVQVYKGAEGWKSVGVRARTYIARMFYEFEFEPDGLRRSHKRTITDKKTGSSFEVTVHTDKPMSSWKVSTSCGDQRCVNPAHFIFLLDAKSDLGGDVRQIRPGAGYGRRQRKGPSSKELAERGWLGPTGDDEK